MSTTITSITVNDNVSWEEVKGRVMAVGVALFFAYLINYAAQAFATFVKKEQGKKQAMKKLLQTTQVLYWFGVASIFSIYPPDFYGTHAAVFAYVTLILLGVLHLLCFHEIKKAGRSLWAIFYVLYHLSIFLWITFAMIISFAWTQENY